MAYQVDITERATRDLRSLYQDIDASSSTLAQRWCNGLEAAILSLGEHPESCPVTPEDGRLRHLLYGKRAIYRIIYNIDAERRTVTVLHTRHGARRPMPGP